MKKILLQREEKGFKYYRANLHCHSDISDGRKSPLQLKNDYKAHGYQILCITDHEVFITHNDMTDSDFLMLNGVELSINPENDNKTCHLCFVSLDKNNKKPICWHREKYYWGNAKNHINEVEFDEAVPDFEREYTHSRINDMIEEGRKNNFFVTYNHPTWSLEAYPEYMGYNGMNAMEIVNFGCVIVGYDDRNGFCYDDMLRGGKRLYAIATDDNHNRYDDEHPNCDSYGGYTYIGAAELTYEAVADALKNGCFYASTGDYKDNGPVINELYYDDGKVVIDTSDAKSIALICSGRHAQNRYAPRGEAIKGAEFVLPSDLEWFRIEVTDLKGNKAYTNAYFCDELK